MNFVLKRGKIILFREPPLVGALLQPKVDTGRAAAQQSVKQGLTMNFAAAQGSPGVTLSVTLLPRRARVTIS